MKLQTILLIFFISLNANSLEYPSLIRASGAHEFDKVLDADYAFSEFLVRNTSKENLRTAISLVKNEAYRGYFNYYYATLVEKRELSGEEILSFLSCNVPEVLLAKSIYFESVGKVDASLEILEKLDYQRAKVTLGWMLIRNNLDFDRGIKILKEQSSNKSTLADAVLGVVYTEKEQYEIANQYLNRALKGNETMAYYTLGANYFYGKGVKKNLEKSKELMLEARRLGEYTKTALPLGFIYKEQKKFESAIKYLEESSLSGNHQASFQLGLIYLEIFDNEDDVNKAISYLELAARNGNRDAYYKLVSTNAALYNMSPKTKYLERANNYIEEVRSFDVVLAEKLELLMKMMANSDS